MSELNFLKNEKPTAITNNSQSITTDNNKAFSVSEINSVIADILNSSLPVAIWVSGEISNLTVASSGHYYFSLKDKDSVIACALFKLSANQINPDILSKLKNGDKIVVKAKITLYKPRGSYQLLVNDIQLAGYGELARAFAELKDKLQKLGFTSPDKKLAIPTFPNEVAVITSPTGAAIRDVLITLKNNAPFVNVAVYPAIVQGEQAVDSILKALAKVIAENSANVILLVRGGGSLEDLQAFNDERVALAVYNCQIPVITGVGHETDVTICDFVSDYRAATPTAAAEKAVPNQHNLQRLLNLKVSQLTQTIQKNYIQKQQVTLKQLNQRLLLQHPKRKYLAHNQKIDEIEFKLKKIIEQTLKTKENQISTLNNNLLLQNPYKKIEHHHNQLLNLEKLLVNNINNRLNNKTTQLKQLQDNINQAINHKTNRQSEYIKGLHARIKLLSPLGILERGYSIIYGENGEIIRSKNDIAQQKTLVLRLADGIEKVDIK